MTREESMLARRLIDLSGQSDRKGIVTYSDFLNLNEQNIFHTVRSELYGRFELYGGYDHAERQMIAFLPDALVRPKEYPIVCLHIEPRNRKFAEALTHRDVLGSLMHLGIERSKLGDILIKEHEIFVFCHNTIRELIMTELVRIRHTDVRISEFHGDALTIQPKRELINGIITSNRLDALIAQMCRLSRSQSGDLIKKGLVFVNGKETVSISYSCKPEDIISVRGYGRFRFLQAYGETKKGRIKVEYEKYV